MSSILETMLSSSALSIAFQPIFDIAPDAPRLWAVEALTRGPLGTHFEDASVLFDYVRLKRDEVRVDRHCCANAIVAAAHLGGVSLVNINAHASTLERDRAFPSYIVDTCRRAGLSPDALIVEIVEHVPYWDLAELRRALAELREAGVRVAIDDLGFGHGNLRMFLDVRPEFVKIERYFVDGCAGDTDRRAVLRAIAALAADFGARVIAEGVERQDDLDTLRATGIGLAQGYLLGRPAAYRARDNQDSSFAEEMEEACERRFSASTTPRPS